MPIRYTQSAGQFHFFHDVGKFELNADGEQVPVLDDKGEQVMEEVYVHSSPEIAVAYARLKDKLHIFTHGPHEGTNGMKGWMAAHNTPTQKHQAELRVFKQGTPPEVLTAAITDWKALAALL